MLATAVGTKRSPASDQSGRSTRNRPRARATLSTNPTPQISHPTAAPAAAPGRLAEASRASAAPGQPPSPGTPAAEHPQGTDRLHPFPSPAGNRCGNRAAVMAKTAGDRLSCQLMAAVRTQPKTGDAPWLRQRGNRACRRSSPRLPESYASIWSPSRMDHPWRGSKSDLFGLHRARGNRRPVRAGFRSEGCRVREAATLPGVSLVGAEADPGPIG
jgi:hypothetical protein